MLIIGIFHEEIGKILLGKPINDVYLQHDCNIKQKKMKKLLSILFAMALCTAPCHAQFGGLGGLLKGAKAANDARKAKKKAEEVWGKKKVKNVIDTTSVEYKKAQAELQQRLDNDPEYQKLKQLQNDSVAAMKYFKEKYGEDLSNPYANDKEYQDAYNKAQKMAGLQEDPVFKKIMAEQRQPTMQEATYLNEKYGTSFEYEGMEAYNDSIGVFANLNGKMKPMGITKPETITDEKPVPDFGQDAIKQYVQDYISFLKKPFADRIIVDSVQNYMIYNKRNADEQFKGAAKFTFYSNLETNIGELTVNEMLLRKISDFTEPIDPKNIFVFRVHKGVGCRYMEYMYSKITYKENELMDYISKRLVNEGYVDASINQKMSDEQVFSAIDKMEFQFKVEKLLKIRQNNEKFMFTNIIPAADDVTLKSNIRKVGGHVTALDITIDAKPGEYAFIIRNPEVEKYFKNLGDEEKDEKKRKMLQNFDISVLTQGAFFFTIN